MRPQDNGTTSCMAEPQSASSLFACWAGLHRAFLIVLHAAMLQNLDAFLIREIASAAPWVIRTPCVSAMFWVLHESINDRASDRARRLVSVVVKFLRGMAHQTSVAVPSCCSLNYTVLDGLAFRCLSILRFKCWLVHHLDTDECRVYLTILSSVRPALLDSLSS
eukprot:2967155-Pleurochrysis_carterae.AAC.1